MASSPSITSFSPRPRRSFEVAFWTVALFMLGLVAGCGDSSGGGDGEAAQTVSALASPAFVRIPADPDGVLLAGSPAAPALDAIGWMAPTPTDPAQVTSDGLRLDRVLAVVAPSASIEEVNAALDGQAAAILSMSGGSPVLVLRIPVAADEADLRVVTEALVATGAFIHAQSIRGPVIRPAVSAVVPISASADEASHWDDLNLYSAWNLGERPSTNDPLRVFNVDRFDSLGLTPGTSGMIFLSTDGNLTPLANDGLHAKSLIAGAIDSEAPGVAPDREVLVASIPRGLLSAIELMHEIAWQIGDDNDLDHFILRTAWNYFGVDEEFDTYPRGNRAVDALIWRIVSATTPGLRDPDILHVVPAGDDFFDNPDAALYQSPWAVSANYPDLLAFAAEGGDAEAAKVRPLWNIYASANPAVAAASPNIITVGAQDLIGEPVPNTAANADLFMPGELIPGACLVDCDSAGIVSLTGSGVASSLAAGALAFIWAVDPELPALEVAVILSLSREGAGFVDLYRALLSVDTAVDVVNAPARLRLLDVAGATLGSLTPNGIFNEVDLETYLEFFEQFETQRETNGVEVDHSRFDLNGNGYTGGDEAALGFSPLGRFDLDADNESEVDVAIQMILGTEFEFEEALVTDAEILCYYGYSELYVGDEDLRDDLLASACRRLKIDFDFPDEIDLGVPTELTILAGEAQGGPDVLVGEEDLLIEVSVIGGSASPSSGMTDAEGLFFTDVTAALDGPIGIEIRAIADDGREAFAEFEVNAGSAAVTLDIDAEIEFGTVTTAIVTVREEDGLPIANANVSILQYRDPLDPSTAVRTFAGLTNEFGEAAIAVDASVTGEFGFIATYFVNSAPYPESLVQDVIVPIPATVTSVSVAAIVGIFDCFERSEFGVVPPVTTACTSDVGNISVTHTADAPDPSTDSEGFVSSFVSTGQFEYVWDGDGANALSPNHTMQASIILGSRFFVDAGKTVELRIEFGPEPEERFFRQLTWSISAPGSPPRSGEGDSGTIVFPPVSFQRTISIGGTVAVDRRSAVSGRLRPPAGSETEPITISATVFD